MSRTSVRDGPINYLAMDVMHIERTDFVFDYPFSGDLQNLIPNLE